ncbi:MAG: M15 family metallopeptidase [Oscillospiraceae bacterium]|nr:M15 family metallopeptidase [Clostridia bacterium]MBQ9167401.1 M15 family metallopeptidase [Oscillospiraceae bacterium]
MMKKTLAALLAALLLVPLLALAEDQEITIEETAGIFFEEISYDDVAWNFPIDLSDMDPELVRLANKHMFLPSDYVPDDLVVMKTRKQDKEGNNTNGGVKKASSSTMKLREECANALVSMLEDALDEGISLHLKSAYRSYQTQATMYYNRLQQNNGKDMGNVTKAGASDHQTGLGCDILPGNWLDKGMTAKMATTEGCQWMAANCARYGFILRYPEDKVEITEINYEPWHFRYVGVPVATYIMENGLCLEEFHVELQAAIDQFLADGGRKSMVKDFIQVSAEND